MKYSETFYDDLALHRGDGGGFRKLLFNSIQNISNDFKHVSWLYDHKLKRPIYSDFPEPLKSLLEHWFSVIFDGNNERKAENRLVTVLFRFYNSVRSRKDESLNAGLQHPPEFRELLHKIEELEKHMDGFSRLEAVKVSESLPKEDEGLADLLSINPQMIVDWFESTIIANYFTRMVLDNNRAFVSILLKAGPSIREALGGDSCLTQEDFSYLSPAALKAIADKYRSYLDLRGKRERDLEFS